MNENFEHAFRQTLGFEGEFSNDPMDYGGKTKYGITEFTLQRAIKQGIVVEKNIINLTVDDAKIIYKMFYWDVINLDKIIDMYIAAELFDTCVNMGESGVGKIVQNALEYLGEKITIDGIIGPITISLLNKWCLKNKKALFIALNCEQYIRYKTIIKNNPTQQIFAVGWLRRINVITPYDF